MKILLVNVHYEHNMSITEHYPMQSLTLRQLAAVTPKKYDLEINEDIKPKNINYNGDYDLVGISTVTPSAPYAYIIADKFKECGKTVVLGGYHPSILPDEAKQHADSVVIGEADLLWPKLLEDFENNKLQSYYEQNEMIDLNLIPNPERERLPSYGVPVSYATRGCPVGCQFCSIHYNKHGNVYRKKSVEKVIEDIKSLNSKSIYLADASLTIDVEYTKRLFRELKGLNKKFLNCMGNVNVLAKDDELLKLASEAGCILWHTGFESVSQETLNSIGKKTNKVEEYKATIKKINDYGMVLFGEFVFGFDSDTPDIFKKTEKIINKWNFLPGFQILTPYPGSPLFNKFEREGRILTKDWEKYTTQNVVFKPKNMSETQLEEGVKYLLKNFYSYPRVFKAALKNLKFGFNKYSIVKNISYNIAKGVKSNK